MANKEVSLENVNVVINDVRIASITIPDGYVPYAFNAHIDNHLLVTGDELQNGMIVIPADRSFRENPEQLEVRDGREISSYARAAVNEKARWSIVTDLKVSENRQNRDLVDFTSLYADGTMIPRTYNKSIKWIVLKEYDFTYFCTFCGLVHDGSEEAKSETPQAVVSAFLKELSEAGMEFFNAVSDVQHDAEKFYNDIAKVFSQFVTYSKEDVEAMQRLYEEQSKLIDDLPKPKPVWVEQIPVSEIEKNDWIPMGGDLYRVIDVQLPTEHGNVILWVQSVSKDPDQHLSTFVLAPSVLVNVKRRVQRFTK